MFPPFSCPVPGPFVCTKKQEAGSKVAADLGWRKKLPSSVGRGYGFVVHGYLLWFMTFRCFLLVHSDVFSPLLVHNVLGGCEFLLTCPGHVSFLQLFGKRYNIWFVPQEFSALMFRGVKFGQRIFYEAKPWHQRQHKRTAINGNDFYRWSRESLTI